MSKDVVVTVTKKGQATIPKALRAKHRIGKKALVLDTKEGVLLKPIPSPADEKASLKDLFGSQMTSKQLIDMASTEERKEEEEEEEVEKNRRR